MSEKVIQWQADTRCGLGVNDPIIGAPVGHWPLSESSATLVWNIELSKNVILLDAGGKTLALDFNDGEIAHQVPLILSEYRGTPTRPSSGTHRASRLHHLPRRPLPGCRRPRSEA